MRSARARFCWMASTSSDIRLSSLRRNVGVVQQDVYLFAGTVFENIRYGKPDASREEVDRSRQKGQCA